MARGILQDQGSNSMSPALAGGFLSVQTTREVPDAVKQKIIPEEEKWGGN